MNGFFFLSLISIVFSYGAYYFTAWIFGSENPTFWATALIITVVVHELGHYIVFKICGIRSCIFVFFILGGAGPIEKEGIEKLKNLSPLSYCSLVIAGIGVNLFSVLVAFGLQKIQIIEASTFVRFAHLNGFITLCNLLPVMALDGNKIIATIFRSFGKAEANLYARQINVSFLTLSIFTSLISNGEVPIFFHIIFMFLINSRIKKPILGKGYEDYNNRFFLEEKEAKIWTAIYLIFLSLGNMLVIGTGNFPFWH